MLSGTPEYNISYRNGIGVRTFEQYIEFYIFGLRGFFVSWPSKKGISIYVKKIYPMTWSSP